MEVMVLYIVCGIFFVWSLLATYFSVKFGLLLLKVQDSIEDSLDILDARYASIAAILEIPLYVDSAEVRRVRDDIKISQEAVLKVASKLTNSLDLQAADNDKEQESA